MGDRARLTIGYTDVVGSTEMTEALGDAAAHQLLRVHEQMVSRAVDAHGGRVVQRLGDGFQLAFPDATRAVRCAMAIQQGLETLRAPRPGEALRVRIGLHTGTVIREGESLMGRTAILAQRIMSRTQGGEILASEETKRRARNFRWVDRGRWRLKGIRESVALHEVSWRPGGLEPEPRTTAPFRALDFDSPFVGREPELRALEALLAEAQDGRGTVVLLTGEPGIGKTRLATEFARAIARRRLRIASGRCSESGGIPFQPFVEFLSGLRSRALRVPRALRADLAPLGALAPELRGRGSPGAALLEPDSEHARRRLLEAFAALWLEWAAEQTLVLVLDDLQWADPQSLALLASLARRLGSANDLRPRRLLLLCTRRDADATEAPELGKALAALEHEHRLRRIALPPLSEPDVLTLLRAFIGHAVRSGAGARAARSSRGNPLFAEELGRELGAGRSRAIDGESAAAAIPLRIQDLLSRRLARLSRGAVEALRIGALVGERFRLEVAASALRVPARDVAGTLDEAVRAHVLREFDEGGDVAYAFDHALVAECLVEETGLAVRRAAHLAIAEALQALGNVRAGEVARHLMGAARLAPPLQLRGWAERAGDESAALFAFADAARFYEAALGALDRLARGESVARAELERKLARALGRTGDVERARSLSGAAIRRFEEAGEERLADEVRVALAVVLGMHALHAEALPHLERAVAHVGRQPDERQAVALAHYAITLDQMGQAQSMRAMARRLRRLAARLGSQELAERAENVLRNWYANHTPQLGRVLRQSQALARSAERRGDLSYAAMYRNEVAFTLFRAGRMREAEGEAEIALRQAGERGATAEVLNARAVLASVACFRGDWSRLEDEWGLSADPFGRVPGALRVGLLVWARRQADLWRGRPLARAPSSRRVYAGMGPGSLAVAASGALFAARAGAADAEERARAVDAALPREGAGLNWFIAAQALAASWVELGRAREAKPWYPRLVPYHGHFYLTSTELELGRIARLGGSLTRAVPHLDRAARVARREALRPVLALALWEKSRALAATGTARDGAAAARCSRRAERIFASLEMSPPALGRAAPSP